MAIDIIQSATKEFLHKSRLRVRRVGEESSAGSQAKADVVRVGCCCQFSHLNLDLELYVGSCSWPLR